MIRRPKNARGGIARPAIALLGQRAQNRLELELEGGERIRGAVVQMGGESSDRAMIVASGRIRRRTRCVAVLPLARRHPRR
jgi:hypothetical protein